MTKPFQQSGRLPSMKRPVDVVGVAEIAKRHGTTAGTVRSWRYRHEDFPKPLAELGMGPVWDWNDVAPWLKSRGGS